MKRYKTSTLIGSDKGGVGKSLIGQFMVNAHDRTANPLNVIEVDHQRKLTSVFGSRVDLSLAAGPSIAQVAKDRRAAERFLNPIYDLWNAGDSLTDLGANVTTPLFDWMESCDIQTLAAEDDIHFRFVAVTNPDDQGLRSAATALEQARRVLGSDALLFLALNDTLGTTGFVPYRQTDAWRRCLALERSHGVKVLSIPFCDSLLMEYGRARGATILDLIDPAKGIVDEIQAEAKLGRIERHAAMRQLLAWISAVQDAIAPLFEHPGDELMAAE